jgi:hypothetical protein
MVSAAAAGAIMAAMMVTGSAAWAAAKYGDAMVEQGTMTVVRGGRSLEFPASGKAINIDEKDLVRVRDNSRVVLKTQDRATVTLGSNAVFQVEPWEQRETKGVFRMLFGRFRASVTGLAGGERFNVRTATATIGVKGTEYSSAVTTGGYTSVLGIESVVENTGSDGVGQPVSPGEVSVTASPATQAIVAPQAFIDAMRDLNSPSPWNPQAVYLPAMQALVDAGVISPAALQKWQQEHPDAVQAPAGSGQGPSPYSDAQQQGGVSHGRLIPHFQK